MPPDDTFMNLVFEQFKHQKENRNNAYDVRVAKAIVKSCPCTFGEVEFDPDDEETTAGINMLHVCRHIEHLGMDAVKLDDFTLLPFLKGKGYAKSDVWKYYEAVQENWPDSQIQALAFDCHGDGLSDTVLHNSARVFEIGTKRGWGIHFSHKEEKFYFQPLKAFIHGLETY